MCPKLCRRCDDDVITSLLLKLCQQIVTTLLSVFLHLVAFGLMLTRLGCGAVLRILNQPLPEGRFKHVKDISAVFQQMELRALELVHLPELWLGGHLAFPATPSCVPMRLRCVLFLSFSSFY